MERDLSSSSWGKTLKTYLILVGCATRRETITYGMIAKRIKVAEIGMNVYLNRIHRYCEKNGLQPLTVLAVSVMTGEVGDGYPGPQEYIYRDRERVYEFDWLEISPPTLEELRNT